MSDTYKCKLRSTATKSFIKWVKKQLENKLKPLILDLKDNQIPELY